MKFRKKPIVIDAVQFRAGEQSGELAKDVYAGTIRYTEDGNLLVMTLEGVMSAAPGDWIIRGVKGELYPCKNDVFALTYEAADDVPVAAYGASLRDILELFIERVDEPPKPNCSCHLAPPCEDCVEYGGLREAFKAAREALK